jgi:hypothetical protein
LPVVADIADEYSDQVVFLGVAGRAGFDETAARAEELFQDRLIWGLDDSIWDLYGIPYQPVTVLLAGNDVIVDGWPGILDEAEIRQRIDALIAVSS